MNGIQYEALLRMFNARRLSPWLPEHEIFIRGEIAKLEVLEPGDAKSFREFYQNKMDVYQAELYKQEHPEEFDENGNKIENKLKLESVLVKAVPEVLAVPKKRGRKPSIK